MNERAFVMSCRLQSNANATPPIRRLFRDRGDRGDGICGVCVVLPRTGGAALVRPVGPPPR
jgi:hypothetical protein